ncbi:SEC14-like protein 2 like protein [Argiope bruennichi]|uniref:SEC14-like protein 2 like protein n=1 Tax=Argiope bruennichi TaxID=94029 RepID=A0A8T0FLT6_ARGBR|nr:SEC14-like protein 2 like protein [Argiope bruennichi]
MNTFTEEEKKVVEELRKRTINDVTPKMLEDVSMFHRFAKARDFNLVEAEAMLRKHIAWRKEMQIDTILTDYEPPEVFLKYVPTSYVCLNKEGCAVRILDTGRIDAKGLWNSTKKMDFAKYCAFCMEYDKDMVFKTGGSKLGKRVFYDIYDFEGMTYANAVNMKSLQNAIYILKMYLDNYPESISVLTVINAPVYFTWIYAAMKPVLPPAVIQKVRIFGTDGWKEVLLEAIDAISSGDLGATKTDPDGNPFCESFIVRGKPIPKSYYIQNRIKQLSLDPDVKKITVMPFSKEEITLETSRRLQKC